MKTPRVIHDSVYGSTKISEPVLLKLMDCALMHRLKGISQLGLPQEFHHLTTYSRFEHSVGTMILVRRMGGSLEEQIAALLHDISHTAFSHIIDWINGTQQADSFQDSRHKKSLINSEVHSLISPYGFSVERVSDHEIFYILEQPIPKGCADRYDYGFRQMLLAPNNRGVDQAIVPFCIDSLTTHDGRIIFNNPRAASLFGWNFLRLSQCDWGSRESIGRFMIFRQILRDAIERGVIERDDLEEDDAFVIDKLKADDELGERLEDLKRPFEKIPDFRKIVGQTEPYKFRWVDPEYLDGGKLVKLTDIDPKYVQEIEEERQKALEGMTI